MKHINMLILITAAITLGSCIIFHFTHKKSSKEWLNYTESKIATGVFTAQDKTGASIDLEWNIMHARSQELLTTMKTLSNFMATTWAPIEVDYLKAHLDEVAEKEYLQIFRPLFAQGIEQVNWQNVNTTMYAVIKNMVETDPKDFFGKHDISIFVFAKDRTTHAFLGFIQYLVKGDYPYGTVNLGNLAVEQTARNRGLGKLLTSSIFMLLQETERIFLYTRPTNKTAQAAYKAYGFKTNETPIADPIFAHGWLMMEYTSKESDILQKESLKLKK